MKETLTVIFIKDTSGGYTATFEEHPEVISEGDTKAEALTLLAHVYSVMVTDKRNQLG